jgi:uncharacterized membrane protein YqjE
MLGGDQDRGDGRGQGFIRPLKAVLGTLGVAFHTRAELFVTELEEERERLKQALLFTLLAVFGLSLGFILLTIFLVAIFWERGWIGAIAGLAMIYLAVGGYAVLKLRSALLGRPGLFPATLGELGKDRDRFKAWSDE